MSEAKLYFKKEETKSPRADGRTAAADSNITTPHNGKDQKKVLFSLKDWS